MKKQRTGTAGRRADGKGTEPRDMRLDDGAGNGHGDGGNGNRPRRFAPAVNKTIAEERALRAAQRDDAARERDKVAELRDAEANRRDLDSVHLEQKIARRGSSLHAAVALARDARLKGAEDRARARKDRIDAAEDRAQAAGERAEMLEELRNAHLDELTGALRRAAGETALEGEIARARRGEDDLVLAFVDVDSLREVNNHDGHAAGDELLCDVVSTIRGRIRSYEPVVRFGGDEFVCVMSGVSRDLAAERFAEISDSVAGRPGGGTISVGFAELRDDDGLQELVDRADHELLAAREQQSHHE
jgi:diguanylate cyclase (GGDEF)-like protein